MRSRLNAFGLAGFGIAETAYSRLLGSSRCCISAHKYHPAINIGGGVEFVPIRHIGIRAEIRPLEGVPSRQRRTAFDDVDASRSSNLTPVSFLTLLACRNV